MNVRAALLRPLAREVKPSPLPVGQAALPRPVNTLQQPATALDTFTPAETAPLAAARAAAAPAGFSSADEKADVAHINARRKRLGKEPLRRDPDLTLVARRWARRMAREGELSHRPNLGAAINRASDKKWLAIGENVGAGSSEKQLWGLWVKSPDHRKNIDKARYDSVGVGAYRDGNGRLWMVQVFADFKGR